VKSKALQRAAQEMMRNIALSRGLSDQQLADRLVPDSGLDARGSRVFDLGQRQFCLVLGPELQPRLRDASGKLRRELPAPTQSEDPVLAEAASAEWKQLKQTLREELKLQAERMEDAMISRRRWTPAEFQTFLVRHPLMTHLVRQLVMAAYDGTDRVTETFRVTADHTFVDQNGAQTALPAGQIGIAHPVQLDEPDRRAWSQVLGEHGIIPPFTQLSREVYRPEPRELAVTEITRFKRPSIPGGVLDSVLLRNHWQAHWHYTARYQHSKHFRTADITAFIRYGYLPGDDVKLKGIYFVRGHILPGRHMPIWQAWWGRHVDRLQIRDVDPIVLSEVLRQAYAIVSRVA
jgi:hypothetical protein